MASNSARNRANIKYAGKNYDRIALSVKKGNREIIRDYAKKKGYSINGYINRLLSDNIPDFISFDDSSDGKEE